MSRLIRFCMTGLLALGLIACDDAIIEEPNIVEAAAADGRFETLVGALEATGLDATLAMPGPYTVFAPTDAAFGLLPDGLVDGLALMDLKDILLYHVVEGDVREADVVGLEEAPTVEGTDIVVQVIDGGVVLDGRVQVTTTDIVVSNGVIHVIDAVLVPGDFPGTVVDALAASPRFDTLASAVVGQGLAGLLNGTNDGNGFTVFAPPNAAFERLPDGLVGALATGGALPNVLAYHVLSGEVDSIAAAAADGTDVETLATDADNEDEPFFVAVDLDAENDLFLDGRTQVTFTDIVARNGIIHVLDSVLVPGGDFPGTTVQALTSYPRFDSLVAAVVGEGLAGVVTDVTVFAPTNDAFASASLGGRALADVLAYHLLGTPKTASELAATETTLESSTISIEAGMGVVINGSANVIRADIVTDDGVVHVIDEVLLTP